MTGPIPSFYALFRRSRYGGVMQTHGDTDEERRSAEQRERFAVAAVGFCLKHSLEFRKHLWQRICRTSGDPQTPDSIQVEVEPVHWADLRLLAEAPGWKCVVVIECKAGAPLDGKQNPSCPEFVQPDHGYGWFIAKRAADTGVPHRYVILGASEVINRAEVLPGLPDEPSFTQRSWCCLAEDSPTTPLIEDLFDSLGRLGISAFRMQRVSQVHLADDFAGAADAWEVLSALGSPDVCGFRSGSWKIIGESPAPGHFNIGAYLRRPSEKMDTCGLHLNLHKTLAPAGNELAWVGYETGPSLAPGQMRRSVYFYCTDAESAEQLTARLATGFPDCLTFREEYCAVLASAGQSRVHDLEWFKSALEFPVTCS